MITPIDVMRTKMYAIIEDLSETPMNAYNPKLDKRLEQVGKYIEGIKNYVRDPIERRVAKNLISDFEIKLGHSMGASL